MVNPDHNEATIAAIATPPGAGGIGIIRLSGSRALPILSSIFRPKNPEKAFVSHKLVYGTVCNPESGRVIDEVLAVYMRAPHTYTREDVVEIHCHGSYLVVQEILALILAARESRLADPGEFTKRAFLNGRIDLTQAEAVAELLDAKTKEGAGLAVAQMQGGLHDIITEIRDSLVSVRAIIEVAIDFPDEDVEILHPETMTAQLREQVLTPLVELLARADQGKIFREGISVVIVGRPNVGKSSLLNSLLQEDRAIVTEIPGTTRDTIEEYLDIRGIPVRIVDTAGIRETCETVEEIGIRRARQKLAQADLVLLMVDGAAGLQPEDLDLFRAVADKKIIVVVNKMDIAPGADVRQYEQTFAGVPVLAISAKTRGGTHLVEDGIYAAVTGGAELAEVKHGCVPNVRHAAALSRAEEACRRVLEGLGRNLPPDLLAIDLQETLDHLGDIVGETTTEDVLDKIFSEFCIGK